MEVNGKTDTGDFSQKVGEKEKRKLKALDNKHSLWFGLGMFGMVGWSVVVPMLLGAGLGIWLDKNYPQSFSWTITLLFGGLFSGCIIAWNWVNKEHKAMNTTKKESL
jgi:ATP synthase protein I